MCRHTHWSEAFPFGEYTVKPEYIKFGQHKSSGEFNHKHDYVFHIRDRKLRRQDNWSLDNWKHLRDMIGPTLGGGSIACIGTHSDSAHIEGTADLRGHELDLIFKVMSHAKCAFGPSSGLICILQVFVALRMSFGHMEVTERDMKETGTH